MSFGRSIFLRERSRKTVVQEDVITQKPERIREGAGTKCQLERPCRNRPATLKIADTGQNSFYSDTQSSIKHSGSLHGLMIRYRERRRRIVGGTVKVGITVLFPPQIIERPQPNPRPKPKRQSHSKQRCRKEHVRRSLAVAHCA